MKGNLEISCSNYALQWLTNTRTERNIFFKLLYYYECYVVVINDLFWGTVDLKLITIHRATIWTKSVEKCYIKSINKK